MKADLRVAKKYDVKWSDYKSFVDNHIEDFIELLRLFNVTYTGDIYYDVFNVKVESYKRMINKLKHADEQLSKIEKHNLNIILESIMTTIDELIECLEKYLNAADLTDGYLHFRFSNNKS